MQIVSNTFNNYQTKHNTNFGIKGSHNPERLLTEKTMKVISAAIASAGIAGIALQQHTDDFAKTFDREITGSELKTIDSDTIAEVMEIAPLLIDIIVTDRSSSGRTRNLTNETLKSLVDIYYTNPELTEQLLLEKDEKGNYKYTANNIKNLVSINESVPELYNLACKDVTFVKNMLDIKINNQPLYGISDIESLYETYNKNPDYTNKLIKQRNEKGEARFNSEQIKYLVENTDEKDKFVSFLLNTTYGEENNYYFNSNQIIELHQLAKDKITQSFVKKLSEPIKIHDSSEYLSAENIIDIVKNPDKSLSELFEKFPYRKEFVLRVYNRVNGQINEEEVREMLKLENKYGDLLFRAYDLEKLKEFSDLFTKEANQLINREYEFYLRNCNY